jgi:hypothetical protein
MRGREGHANKGKYERCSATLTLPIPPRLRQPSITPIACTNVLIDGDTLVKVSRFGSAECVGSNGAQALPTASGNLSRQLRQDLGLAVRRRKPAVSLAMVKLPYSSTTGSLGSDGTVFALVGVLWVIKELVRRAGAQASSMGAGAGD